MNTIEQRYAERAKLTVELARRFNNVAIKHKSILRLKVNDDGVGASFQFVYELDDALLEGRLYSEGNAIIYPADNARELVLDLAKELGQKVSWNNTATIGWFGL